MMNAKYETAARFVKLYAANLETMILRMKEELRDVAEVDNVDIAFVPHSSITALPEPVPVFYVKEPSPEAKCVSRTAKASVWVVATESGTNKAYEVVKA